MIKVFIYFRLDNCCFIKIWWIFCCEQLKVRKKAWLKLSDCGDYYNDHWSNLNGRMVIQVSVENSKLTYTKWFKFLRVINTIFMCCRTSIKTNIGLSSNPKRKFIISLPSAAPGTVHCTFVYTHPAAKLGISSSFMLYGVIISNILKDNLSMVWCLSFSEQV